ncbi:signal transduction histidine kinase [Sinomonas cellulolyticus]|uniref:Histidine kinase n=1 Tax=Sinomonas cellulolyticus TaxID=2801916 RepID=A0ABS1K5B2_9MICC|nr:MULTISPECIES: histidine kinase [Sinomonas]MBL0706663.1 histidine kinase [Sinomonas cellulolyticus]GHG56014.1 signal transduction histidine kinase [Sinomonas sp. KCTC 49339]
MSPDVLTFAALVLVLAVGAGVGAVAWRVWRGRRDFGSEAERASYTILHSAAQAGRYLRSGLEPEGAAKAARHLRSMLGAPALALTDESRLLAWDGEGTAHAGTVMGLAEKTLAQGRVRVAHDDELDCAAAGCTAADCQLREAVVAPVRAGGRVIGTVVAFSPSAGAGLVRAAGEVADWVATQAELAELDRSRTLLMEAEVRALRAQISPHFIYNSLTAIASYILTDPARARELVVEFADFTRYSFRRHGDFTTLSEELRSIDQYLLLERARFGERLQVSLRIAPEVLGTLIPFLSLQPLVENAVRHGLEAREGVGHISITAEDTPHEAVVQIEDDGAGMDPERLRDVLAGHAGGAHVGLRNVDARLRQVYGDDHGLVVETAPGQGTLITMRIPKSQPQHEVRPPVD